MRFWSRQRDLLHAIAVEDLVAVRSGQKTGKTTTLAIAAWWWFCTKPRAQVIITAPGTRQVEEILYGEICRLFRSSRWPLTLKDPMKSAAAGIRSADDSRKIFGFSTTEPEKMQGYSGPNNLFLVDEASGMREDILGAILGNRMGGAHVCLISNPTQLSGTYYDAFHSKAASWKGIQISSEECAREIGDDPAFAGLANAKVIDEYRRDYGEDSAFYSVRVKGEFPPQGGDTMIPVKLVDAAEERWSEGGRLIFEGRLETVDSIADQRHSANRIARIEAPEGRLTLGVDVARFGPDRSVIVPRRGLWVGMPKWVHGFDTVAVTGLVRQMAHDFGRPGERVRVVIDTSNMGSGVADPLSRESQFEVIQVFSSAGSTDGSMYSRKRDELWGGLVDWLKSGGAIPALKDLRTDLVAPKYGFDAHAKLRVEPKPDIRKRLGRSTDFADALAMAVWDGEQAAEWDPVIVSLSGR